MKLMCKDTNNGTFTMFSSRGRYAFNNYYYGDNVSANPDPTQGAAYNSNIEFKSNRPGFCYVDYGDGTKGQYPFVKQRGSSTYSVIFRSLDVEWRKSPNGTWWFRKEDGSQYVPVPNHDYGYVGDHTISFSFSNDVHSVSSNSLVMRSFPVLDIPGLGSLHLTGIGAGAGDIPVDRIKRSVNITHIGITDGGHRIKSIPEEWKSLSKMRTLDLSNSCDFRDTESSNIRKLPEIFPDLTSLNLAGSMAKVYPREWLGFNNLESLTIHSCRRTEGYDPDTMISMDEVDGINPTLTKFLHLGSWYCYEDQKDWHPYMLGKGLENIKEMNFVDSWDIDLNKIPEYIREMRGMTLLSGHLALRSLARTDLFVDNFYEYVTGWDKVTMSGNASDGKRNQFYGLRVSIYSSSYINQHHRPSGALQAPSGFVKGVSNGDPQTPMERIYVLTNNYNQVWTVKPEGTASLMSSRTRVEDPYMVVVSGEDVIIGHGDVLCDKDASVHVAYGEDGLMEVMSDNGLDMGIAIDYIENERREVENYGQDII